MLNRIKLKTYDFCYDCKNINWISLIRPGKPEDVILEVAEDENVDQIIMGKSGKNAIERFLLGSTT